MCPVPIEEVSLRRARASLVLEQFLDGGAHRHPFRCADSLDYWKGTSENAVDTIPPAHFLAPACVIDCSAESAADADFVLTRALVEAWEARHGRIPARSWVLLRTDWHKRPTGHLTTAGAGPGECGPSSDRFT
jgi:hypothetical protein